ncbi:MAG: hypothetical protein JKX71_08525 [Amylibacter sp.]|nr:hypothetical protein [Amylibacter sp.]
MLISTLILSACGGGRAYTSPSRQAIIPKTEIINVANGSLSITPPSGFCKDADGSKETKTSAFIIFANCGYLNSGGRRASGDAGFTGLVTTSVTKEPGFQGPDDINALSDFLSSREGLETLSTSGDTKAVSIVDKRQTSDGVYLQLRDTNAALSQNVWKSFINRSDYLVTVTLLQNKKSTLTDEQSMQFLQSYSESINSQAARQSSEQVQPVQQTNSTSDNPKQKNNLKKIGILRRLFL